MGKRWEDLIDAAASATEEDSRDLTPVSVVTLPFIHFLTYPGAAVAISLAAHQQSEVPATVCCSTFPVLHSFTIAAQSDPTTARHVRSTAISFRRVLY